MNIQFYINIKETKSSIFIFLCQSKKQNLYHHTQKATKNCKQTKLLYKHNRGCHDHMVVDLQLPVQSVPITTTVVWTPFMAICDQVCQWLVTGIDKLYHILPRSTQRKPPTCYKSLTNFITYCHGVPRENHQPVTSHWQTLSHIATDYLDKVCQWLVTGWWFSLGTPWQYVIKFVNDL
jgi:hypothetical protein